MTAATPPATPAIALLWSKSSPCLAAARHPEERQRRGTSGRRSPWLFPSRDSSEVKPRRNDDSGASTLHLQLPCCSGGSRVLGKASRYQPRAKTRPRDSRLAAVADFLRT